MASRSTISLVIHKGYKKAATYDYNCWMANRFYQQNRYDPFGERRGGTDDDRKEISDFPTAAIFRTPLCDAGKIIKSVFEQARVVSHTIGRRLRRPARFVSPVFVCEGEKNADLLIKAGLLATTAVSHDWTEECVAALTGYDCFILEDHDKNGRKLAADAQRKLSKVARSTRIVPLLHLWKHLDPEHSSKTPAEGYDIEEWLGKGGDPKKLLDICREIPADGAITASPHEFPDEANTATWDWLYGKHLLRKNVAGTVASGALASHPNRLSRR